MLALGGTDGFLMRGEGAGEEEEGDEFVRIFLGQVLAFYTREWGRARKIGGGGEGLLCGDAQAWGNVRK
jgi:hypothetical protein